MAVDQWSTSPTINRDVYPGGDWALPKDRNLPVPSLVTAPISASPQSAASGGGFLDSLASPSSILGGLGGGGGAGAALGGLGGMPSLSVAPSATATVGDAQVEADFTNSFYSPFAVGSGANAEANSSGKGLMDGENGKIILFAVVGLTMIFSVALLRK